MTAPVVKIRKRRIGTGSAMERLLRCPSSIALPHVHYESEATERGSVAHDFLANIPTMGREAALEAVPDEWRDAIEQIDLTGIEELLVLAPEIAAAYDCETDTARELGRGTDSRGFWDDVKDSEITVRSDAVGIRAIEAGRRGLIVSWKTGWYSRRKKVASDVQTKIEALTMARVFDLDIVEVQLICLDEGPPYVQKHVYSSFQLDQIANEVAEYYAVASKVRAEYEAGIVPDRFEIGDWCTYCPAQRFCPAYTGQVRALAAGDATKELLSAGQITEDMMRWAWTALEAAERDVATFKRMVYAAASSYFMGTGAGPIWLGDLPDGRARWLARIITPGNEQVDGNTAFDVLAEAKEILADATDAKGRRLLSDEAIAAIDGEQLACEATTVETSKKAIGEAVKRAVPKGKGARAIDALLKAIRERGGITQKPSDKIDEYVTKTKEPPEHLFRDPPKELPAPAGEDPRAWIDTGFPRGDDITAPMPADEEGGDP